MSTCSLDGDWRVGVDAWNQLKEPLVYALGDRVPIREHDLRVEPVKARAPYGALVISKYAR